MILKVQGLRGIAIIAVVLFHLFPQNFPNGYIGVDIFFVLSGFLMAMIFTKYETITHTVMWDFYCKRLKRIFPLYYLMIPLIYISGQLFLNHAWVPMNNERVVYAMILLKNMQTIWDGKDYFAVFQTAAPSKDLFLHTWSLAVEIQFYLFVPFIFLALAHFPKPYYKIGILGGMSLISCAQYYYSNPIFSFNYPLSRLWQFGAGMIAYCLNCENGSSTEKELPETTKPLKTKSNWAVDITGFLFVLLIWPVAINSIILRPLLTFAATLLLCNGSILTNKCLQNYLLKKIGDISYTLYLVHWPVIVIFKNEDVASYQLCIALIILSSIILYNYYEKFYRTLSMQNIFILLAVLITFNAGTYLSVRYIPAVTGLFDNFRLSKLDPIRRHAVDQNYIFSNTKVEDIVKCRYNQALSASTKQFERPWGVCDYEKGHGTSRILVVGNSYAMNQANIIMEEFKGNYSTFRLITNLGLQVLYDNFINSPSQLYFGQHDVVLNMIEEYAPDFIFIATRHQDLQKHKIQAKNISEDTLVKLYDRTLERLENSTVSKIFIQGSTPLYPMLHLSKFIESMIDNLDLKEFHLNKQKANDEMENSERRIDAIKCAKCEKIDTRSAFLDEDRYLGYDPTTLLSFIDNNIHFTNAGLERMRPVYREVINNL